MADNTERYLAELKGLIKDEEIQAIPDRVKDYTHDINGKRLPCEFIQLNEQYVHHLNKIPKHIQAGNDYFGLCFGYPGAGKTHLMIRTCLYLNADFSLNDISFTIDQLEEWIQNAEPGAVGLFDEADAISNGYYDQALRALIRNGKRIRTKRLVLFFNTPTMRDMHPYFAFRAKMVIYSFVPKKTAPDNRGWIHVWHDQDLIADLFARMKKAYSETSRVYDAAYCTLKNKYVGRVVPKDWPINEDEYEAKKEEGRKQLEEDANLTPRQAVLKARNQYIGRAKVLIKEYKAAYRAGEPIQLTQTRMAEVFGLSDNQFSSISGGDS